MRHPLLPETIEKISASQTIIFMTARESLVVSMTIAEETMKRALADNAGDLWTKAYRRAQEVKSQLSQ
jgi:hypothetical protein